MSLKAPVIITQSNYANLEAQLQRLRTAQTDGAYHANFCCIKTESTPISSIDVIFVNDGLLAFKKAGISISVTSQSEVLRGYFIPTPDKLRYKENPNHLQSDGIRWASIANATASVIWVPEGYSRLKIAEELVIGTIKRIAPASKKYDPSLVTRTLENIYA